MPLGMMNKWYGKAIGDEVGTFLEMDKEEDGSAVGEFLRIKIKLDIRKPLMRGVTLISEEKEGEKDLWCPVVYEFLPDFCYNCGIIGHIDRWCDKERSENQELQFGRALRYTPQKKSFESSGSWAGATMCVISGVWVARGVEAVGGGSVARGVMVAVGGRHLLKVAAMRSLTR
jgi:hypothetical protein